MFVLPAADAHHRYPSCRYHHVADVEHQRRSFLPVGKIDAKERATTKTFPKPTIVCLNAPYTVLVFSLFRTPLRVPRSL